LKRKKRSNAKPKSQSLTSFTILDAIKDDNLFRPFFSDKSWRNWKVFLRALFSLPMGPKSREIFHECTQRETRPKSVEECWVIAGRRAGKSRISALIATYLATCRDYSPYLAPGETAVIMVIAENRKQAQIILNYIDKLLT